MTWNMNPFLTSNDPTHYLLDHGEFFLIHDMEYETGRLISDFPIDDDNIEIPSSVKRLKSQLCYSRLINLQIMMACVLGY